MNRNREQFLPLSLWKEKNKMANGTEQMRNIIVTKKRLFWQVLQGDTKAAHTEESVEQRLFQARHSWLNRKGRKASSSS